MKRRKENCNNVAIFMHSPPPPTHYCIFILVLISSFVTHGSCRRHHRDEATGNQNSVGIMTGETLNFITKPQVVILLNETSTEFTVKLDKSYAPDPNPNGLNYKLSVALEILDVKSCNENKWNWAENSEDGIMLLADPDQGNKNSTNSISICAPVDYTSNYFQNTAGFLIGDRLIKISVGKGWVEGDRAQLVATVFYEKNDCDDCEAYTFCCEDTNDSFSSRDNSDESSDLYGNGNGFMSSDMADAEGVRYGPEFHQLKGPGDSDRNRDAETSQKKVHCIPLITVCNKHGNCAMKNNDDEEDHTCFCYNWTSPCMSYQFLWTALLAIVFFILAPTSIVFLICYHRQMRNFRQRIAENSVTVSSPVNDLPPTYEEIEEPPPCFCYATANPDVNLNSGNGIDPALVLRLGLTSEPDGGIDNAGFTPHLFPDPEEETKVTCTCGRGGDRDTDTDAGPKSITSDETDPGWNSGLSRFSMRALIARVRPSRPGPGPGSIFGFSRGRRNDEEQTGDRTMDGGGNSNRNLSHGQATNNNNYYNNRNRVTSTSQSRQNSIVNSNYGNIGV